MQELSFIKKDSGPRDYNSFMDSFTLVENEKHSGKKEGGPEVMLVDEDPMALFKDIVEEEFDLEEEMDEVHNIGTSGVLISQNENFDRSSLLENHMQDQ